MFFAMVGLAFTMGKPHPYRCDIIKMINSCCVHNGERIWCDFSGPVVGGVPCGKGDGSKDGGTSGFRCTLWLFNIAIENGPFIDDFPIKTSIYG